MALAFDSIGTNTTGGTVTSWTHTVGVGSNPILLVYVFNGGTQPPVANLKFAGTALTLLKSGTQTGDPISGQLWYLLNPPSGLGTFNGTYLANSGGEIDSMSVSYLGVNQSTPFAGSAIKIGTSTPAGSVTFTSLPANAWSVGFITYDNNTGTTKIGNQRGTAGQGAMVVGMDSTGGTLQGTNSNSSSNFVMIGAELQAAPSGTVSSGPGYRSLLGVGQI